MTTIYRVILMSKILGSLAATCRSLLQQYVDASVLMYIDKIRRSQKRNCLGQELKCGRVLINLCSILCFWWS